MKWSTSQRSHIADESIGCSRLIQLLPTVDHTVDGVGLARLGYSEGYSRNRRLHNGSH